MFFKLFGLCFFKCASLVTPPQQLVVDAPAPIEISVQQPAIRELA